MKKNSSRRLLYISIGTIFLGLVSAILINLLTNDEEINNWLKGNGSIAKWWIISGIALAFILAVLFAIYQFRLQPRENQTAESIISEGIESDVKKFHDSLKESYRQRYESKLDGRFEIKLEVSEDWHSDKPKTYKFDAEAKISDAVDAVRKAFDDKGRLLIVGSPGSGKTVLMLNLARQLLGDEYKTNQKLPVIFNLASWSEDYKTFEDWLIDVLNSGNGLSKDFAKTVLREKRIIFLLDGLDELARNEDTKTANEKRSKCLDSLNDYLREGRKAVICCRREEFAEMQKTTNRDAPVSAKVEVLDLTKADILLALQDARKHNESRASADHLEQIVETNDVFLEILCTPFYFTTAIEVFDKHSLKETDFPIDEEEAKKYLLNNFVKSKINYTQNLTEFEKDTEKINKWLKWLAQLMEKKHLVTFELADLQPNDLAKRWHFGLFGGAGVGLIIGFVFCLFAVFVLGGGSGFLAGLVVRLLVGFFIGFVMGLTAGLVYGLVYILFLLVNNNVSKAAHTVKLDFIQLLNINFWKKLILGILTGMCIGSLGGLLLNLLLGGALERNLFLSLVFSLIFGLVFSTVLGLDNNSISTEDIVKLDFIQLLNLNFWKKLVFGLFVGLLGGLAVGLVFTLYFNLVFGLMVSLFFGLFFGLEGLKKIESVTYLQSPYQRIYGGFFINLAFALGIFLVLLGFALSLDYIANNELNAILQGLSYFIVFLPVISIIKAALFQHLILRFCLYFEYSMPLKFATFLDYAAEARILEKDGGHWRFRHQNLQEYFASLPD